MQKGRKPKQVEENAILYKDAGAIKRTGVILYKFMLAAIDDLSSRYKGADKFANKEKYGHLIGKLDGLKPQSEVIKLTKLDDSISKVLLFLIHAVCTGYICESEDKSTLPKSLVNMLPRELVDHVIEVPNKSLMMGSIDVSKHTDSVVLEELTLEDIEILSGLNRPPTDNTPDNVPQVNVANDAINDLKNNLVDAASNNTLTQPSIEDVNLDELLGCDPIEATIEVEPDIDLDELLNGGDIQEKEMVDLWESAFQDTLQTRLTKFIEFHRPGKCLRESEDETEYFKSKLRAVGLLNDDNHEVLTISYLLIKATAVVYAAACWTDYRKGYTSGQLTTSLLAVKAIDVNIFTDIEKVLLV
jgi:hypothetical protein